MCKSKGEHVFVRVQESEKALVFFFLFLNVQRMAYSDISVYNCMSRGAWTYLG